MEWLQHNKWIVFDREQDVWLPGRDYSRISFASWLQALPWRVPKVETWPESLDDLTELRQELQTLQHQETNNFAAPLASYLTDYNPAKGNKTL